MSFQELIKTVQNKQEITVNGQTLTVDKLTVKELEQYKNIVNRALGTVKMGMGNERNLQSANMNVEQVSAAQDKADHYLIQCSFKDEEIGEEEIDKLYDLYTPLVEALKKVNNINETDNSRLESDLKNS